MSATILNTDSNINAKTVMCAENAETVTGVKTFDLDPNPPFVVTSGSANVPNLDADKVDGIDGLSFARWDGGGTPLGQIAFPATQSASSGANVLDDYEEGSFTPTIVSSGGGTPTYTTQVGRYIKIGKQVTFWGRITTSAFNTLAAGTITIESLPFTAENTTNLFGFVHIPFFVITTNVASLMGFVQTNSQQISVRYIPAAGDHTVTILSKADLAAASDIIFGGSYQAAQ